MLTIFGQLSSLFKISRVHIDGSVFRLHYRVTVPILVAFSLVVTATLYVGKPIECMHSKGLTESVINTFCWIHSTFTIPDAFHKKVGIEVPYPGIDTNGNGTRKYHGYYQWVAMVLFLQAALFYVPRWLWKHCEGGKIQSLMMELNRSLLPNKERRERTEMLIEYLWNSRRTHNFWAVRYFLCEFLSLINVLGQLFLMDRFFQGQFLTYGIRVIQFLESDQEDRIDPMMFIFPRVTKCQFYKFGHSGDVEKLDAMCVLPLNVVNEKIYIFLWFWFILVAMLTCVVLVFRVALFCSVNVRVCALQVNLRVVAMRGDLINLVGHTDIGDWFLFYVMSQNVDILVFKEVIGNLAIRIEQENINYKLIV